MYLGLNPLIALKIRAKPLNQHQELTGAKVGNGCAYGEGVQLHSVPFDACASHSASDTEVWSLRIRVEL